MRAKFINEIRKGTASGIEALGIGKASLPDMPKMMKKLVKTWFGSDIMWMDSSTTEMKVSYSHESNIHTLEFDYSDISLDPSKIENPTVIYNELNYTIYVNFGKPKTKYLSYAVIDIVNYPESMTSAIDLFGDEHEIITQMFYNLDNLRTEYGSHSEYYKKDEKNDEPYDDRLGGGGLYY